MIKSFKNMSFYYYIFFLYEITFDARISITLIICELLSNTSKESVTLIILLNKIYILKSARTKTENFYLLI